MDHDDKIEALRPQPEAFEIGKYETLRIWRANSVEQDVPIHAGQEKHLQGGACRPVRRS